MNEGTKRLNTYVSNLNFKNEKYTDIIEVEHRNNNSKRDYLFVNKIQSKHIPCDPNKMVSMCKDLANEVNKTLNDKYSNILVVGFAETATAIANFVATEVHNVAYLMCTTREDIKDDAQELITFEEEHSHATTQKLFTWCKERQSFDFKLVDYILFVEDEISTGNTILNFIRAFKSQNVINNNVIFGVASICNWQDFENREKFKLEGVQTFALITGELCDVNIKMGITEEDLSEESTSFDHEYNIERIDIEGTNYFNTLRLGAPLNVHINMGARYAQLLDKVVREHNSNAQSIRVIGTEECMAPAIQLALELSKSCDNVICHSTTRSKIDILKGETGLTSRYILISAYQIDRPTYIYNLETFTDLVVVVTDSKSSDKFLSDIYTKLNTNNILAIRLL